MDFWLLNLIYMAFKGIQFPRGVVVKLSVKSKPVFDISEYLGKLPFKKYLPSNNFQPLRYISGLTDNLVK